MAIKIIWSNPDGELDRAIADSENGAFEALIEMIKETGGMISAGDRFEVSEMTEEDPS